MLLKDTAAGKLMLKNFKGNDDAVPVSLSASDVVKELAIGMRDRDSSNLDAAVADAIQWIMGAEAEIARLRDLVSGVNN